MARDYLPLALASSILETGQLVSQMTLEQNDSGSIYNQQYVTIGNDGATTVLKYNTNIRRIVCGTNGLLTYTDLQTTGFPGAAIRKSAGGLISNKFYVLGGENSSSVAQSTCYAYDIATNTWATLAPYPGSFPGSLLSVTVNGKIYTKEENTNSNTTIRCYDPATNTWSLIATLPGQGAYDGQFFYGAGALYYRVGQNGSTTTNSLIRITLAGAISSMAQVPIQTAGGTHAVVIDNMAYFFGGYNAKWTMYVYDILANKWTLASTPFFDGSSVFFGFSQGANAAPIGNPLTGGTDILAFCQDGTGPVQATGNYTYLNAYLCRWAARGRLSHVANLRALKALAAS